MPVLTGIQRFRPIHIDLVTLGPGQIGKMISDPKEGDIHQLKRVLLGANLMPCGRRPNCPYLRLRIDADLEEVMVQLESHSVPGAEILSYVVASGDMRFIEINERTIFLRDDPMLGAVIRGEVPGCGGECYANLSQILLESVMSSGDSREAQQTSHAATQFGRRLGQKLSEHFIRDQADLAAAESPAAAIAILLNSMGVPFESELSGDLVRFTMARCPLRTAAAGAAMTLWVTPAHRAFVELVKTLLQGIAPGWMLRKPDEMESEAPLREIKLVKS